MNLIYGSNGNSLGPKGGAYDVGNTQAVIDVIGGLNLMNVPHLKLTTNGLGEERCVM